MQIYLLYSLPNWNLELSYKSIILPRVYAYGVDFSIGSRVVPGLAEKWWVCTFLVSRSFVRVCLKEIGKISY